MGRLVVLTAPAEKHLRTTLPDFEYTALGAIIVSPLIAPTFHTFPTLPTISYYFLLFPTISKYWDSFTVLQYLLFILSTSFVDCSTRYGRMGVLNTLIHEIFD